MIKELDYTKEFGERLAQKRDEMDFPRNCLFEITHRCNLRCRHCYVVPEPRRKELNTWQVKSIFEQLADAGCLHLTLTGGEPLVREDILSLIDYARRIGLFIHLFTNATLITASIADKLKELKPVSLEISFHSLKKKRFDWFTQIEGSFDLVMRAIKLLKMRKLKIALKINITKLNLDEIEDLKGFGNDLDAVVEWATLLRPRSDGSKDNLFLRLEPEEVLKVGDMLGLKSIDDEYPSSEAPKEGSGRNWVQGKLFNCGLGKQGLVISPYGGLKSCLELPSSGYFILDNSLKQGWLNLRSYVDSMKSGANYKCFDCKYRDFCLSCPAKASLECGDMNSCSDYYRRLAELSLKNNGYKKSRI